MARPPGRWRPSRVVVAGFGAVVLVRASTMPRGLWELDEGLFALGIERFEPLANHPHAPGYPLLIGLGKLLRPVFGDPWTSLVALSLLASLVSYPALVTAFRRVAGDPGDRIAVAAALLYLLSPVMLVQGPLPLSDPPSMMFIALALAAAARACSGGGVASAVALGACASAAIGCRPSNAVAVVPMLAVALWQTSGRRLRLAGLAAFAAVSLGWLVPLVAATGGWVGFATYQLHQIADVARHDATASRAGRSFIDVAKRFVISPWGPYWLSLPLLAFTVAGTVRMVRSRLTAALPLAILSATHLAFCLAVMDPGDGPRYALPWVLGAAFATVLGAESLAARAGKRVLTALVPALVIVLGFLFTLPVLVPRATSPSPVAQAAAWAERELVPKTILLVSGELRPQAAYLLRGFPLFSVEEGLRRAARRPRVPAYLFAEGETDWPDTRIFAWPPSQAYRRLTRNHYRVVSLSPLADRWRFEPVHGIQGFEPDLRHASWRRLDADARLRLYPRGARRAIVELALDAESAVTRYSVALTVNAEPAGDVVIPRGAVRQTLLKLPARFFRAVELGLRSSPSFEAGASGPVPADALRLLGAWTAPARCPPIALRPRRAPLPAPCRD